MNSTEIITNSINAFSVIDGLKFSLLVLLTTSATTWLGNDGYMSDMSKLTAVSPDHCFKPNKILQNSKNQLDNMLSIRDYCKLVIFKKKKIKSTVKKKLKTLDKKYKKLINKSRLQLNDLSEEDIKLHRENRVKKLSTVEITD